MGEIKDRHRKAEKKRRQDVRKMNDLANSINPNRPIPGIEKATLKAWPQELVGMECMFGEVYTYLKPDQKWFDLYNLIEEAVAAKNGEANFNFEKGILTCKMKLMGNNQQEQNIEFSVEIFESREWKDQYKKLDMADEVVEKNEHQIFITRINRIGGDRLTFDKLKKGFLLMHCSEILKGLPQWAREMEENGDNVDAQAKAKEVEQDDQKEDEYDAVLEKVAIWKEADEKQDAQVQEAPAQVQD